jgi:hypothetical protein
MSEAFLYIWYIASTGMYYIGYSTKDSDEYTHSSRDKEFCKLVPNSRSSIVGRRDFLKNIPKGIRRKVLARGTKEEIEKKEHELLEKVKEKCWDRYYNLATCYPPPPRCGSENPPVSPEGVIYNSIRDAGKKLGKSKTTISNWCNTNRYGWCWKEDLGKPFKPIKIGKTSPRRCVSPEGVVYVSVREAERETGVPCTTLLSWCNKTYTNSHKYGWYWEEDLGKPPKPIKLDRRILGRKCVSPEGVVYRSGKQASDQTGVPNTTIKRWCHANKNGWYWEDSPPTNLDMFSA